MCIRDRRDEASGAEVSTDAWAAVYEALKGAFAVRQLARTTRKTYRGWIRDFQRQAGDKKPEDLRAEDAAAYLTWLAVERQLGASAQNQAFNALVRLF